MNSKQYVKDLKARASEWEKSEGKQLIAEAIACYQAGSYRSCILATWLSVVFDYVGKLRELEMNGDAQAKQELLILENALIRQDVTKLLNFERSVLENAKTNFEFISQIELNELQRLEDDRNKCAHPSMNAIDEPYKPTAAAARYHMNSAIEYMLSRPTAHGKAILDVLLSKLESFYFPIESEKVVEFLKATPLIRPRFTLLRNLIVILLKKAIHRDDYTKNFINYTRTLEALEKLHPETVKTILKSEFNRLVSISKEDSYGNIVRLLLYTDILAEYLQNDNKIKLQEYVRILPKQDRGPLLFALIIIDKPIFSESLKLFLRYFVDEEDIFYVVSSINHVTKLPETIIERAISIYSKCNSYTAANKAAKGMIIPLAPYMNRQQVELVLEGIYVNRQLLESTELGNVLIALASLGDETKSVVLDWIKQLDEGPAEYLRNAIALGK